MPFLFFDTRLCLEVKAKIGRFIWEQDEMLGVTVSILFCITLFLLISIGRKSSLTPLLLKTPHGNRSTGQMLNIQPDAKGSQTEKRNKRYARLSYVGIILIIFSVMMIQH